jgi:DNA polymerase-1
VRGVHLFDGHYFIFRAWFSLPPLTAPDGSQTQAAYGFTSTLLKYLADPELTHAAVCLDHTLESFRNELEPGYKATRGEPPAELEAQFDLCREVLRALGIPCYEAPDYEADDVIATLCRQLAARGVRVEVHTSDKDLAQVVREDGRVVLRDPRSGERIDADAVRARFGVDPARIPDYLGLVGDAVDNLPGVPGVGPKTAGALLRAFGSLEAIPEDPAAWEGLGLRGAARLAGRIAEHRERALRTRDLATLRDDVPGLEVRPDDLALRGASREAVRSLFERLGWGRIAERIPRWADAAPCGRN